MHRAPSTATPQNTDSVQRFLGSAYDNVLVVYQNLDAITLVSNNIEALLALDVVPGGVSSWNDLEDKPLTFPSTIVQVADLESYLNDLTAALIDLEFYVDGGFRDGIDDDLALKQDLSQKNQANGYVGLDGSTKINPIYLPAIAITDRFVVNSQAAMLALTAETGDIAIRTDILETFILSGDPAVLANWEMLLHPTSAVTSAFGRTGIITAQSGDYDTDMVTEGATNKYHTVQRVRTTTVNALNPGVARAQLVNGDTFTGLFDKISRWYADFAAIVWTGNGGDLVANTVTNAKLAQIAANRFKGRVTPGTGDVEELTGTQATTLLDVFTNALKGLVPPSGGGTTTFLRADGTWAAPGAGTNPTESITIALSDEYTAPTAGVMKAALRMPYAFTLTEVRAALTYPQTSGSIMTVDVNQNGVSILSTKLTIDNNEETSTSAAIAPVISTTSLVGDAKITFDIDQIGDGTATGLKVTLIGHKT